MKVIHRAFPPALVAIAIACNAIAAGTPDSGHWRIIEKHFDSYPTPIVIKYYAWDRDTLFEADVKAETNTPLRLQTGALIWRRDASTYRFHPCIYYPTLEAKIGEKDDISITVNSTAGELRTSTGHTFALRSDTIWEGGQPVLHVTLRTSEGGNDEEIRLTDCQTEGTAWTPYTLLRIGDRNSGDISRIDYLSVINAIGWYRLAHGARTDAK